MKAKRIIIRILQSLLITFMVLFTVAGIALRFYPPMDFRFYLDEGENAAVYSYRGKSDNITLPTKFLWKDVVAVKSFSFSGQNIKHIIVPDGITELNEAAFGKCITLESVTLPKRLKKIGNGLFCECEKLKEVKIPDDWTSIPDYTFIGCESLEEMVIPEGVKTIGVGAFENCYSLKKVTLPESLEVIDAMAFNGCEKLETIELPKNLKVIGDYAFKSCSGLREITFPDSLESVKTGAFQSSGITSVHMENNKIKIDSIAFSDCDKLHAVYITSAGEYDINSLAFSDNYKEGLLGKENLLVDEPKFYFDGKGIDFYKFAAFERQGNVHITNEDTTDTTDHETDKDFSETSLYKINHIS